MNWGNHTVGDSKVNSWPTGSEWMDILEGSATAQVEGAAYSITAAGMGALATLWLIKGQQTKKTKCVWSELQAELAKVLSSKL
jgi:hypothetical protein